MAYDTSTANPVNPQGTAGGGNIFNAGTIFGTMSVSGLTAEGGNPSTTSQDTAALGGSSTPTLTQPGSLIPSLTAGTATTASTSLISLLTSPLVLIALAGLGVVLAWKYFRK